MVTYGNAFRLRGAGYVTLNLRNQDQSEDEVRFWEIVNAMPREDAAVIGRLVDMEWKSGA